MKKFLIGILIIFIFSFSVTCYTKAKPEITGSLVITDHFIIKYHGYTSLFPKDGYLVVFLKDGRSMYICGNFVIIGVFDENYDVLIQKLKLQDKVCLEASLSD